MNRSLIGSPAARIAGLFLLAALTSAESCPSDIGDGDQPSEYTILVSKSAQGGASSGPGGGSIRPSADEFGAFVSFDSDAVNLTADGNAKRDVFVRERNRSANSTVLASLRDPDDAQGDQDSGAASMSADGTTVAFESMARLGTGVPSPVLPDGHLIFVRNFLPGGVTRAVLTGTDLPGAAPIGYMRGPSISGDGRYVAFYSNVIDLAQPQSPPPGSYTVGNEQVYIADMGVSPPVITLISHAAGAPGTPGNNNSRFPKITRDGSAVAFESDASNLAGATGFRQIFVGYRSGADCEIVSRHDDDSTATQFCYSPSISYDGSLVAFVANDPGFAAVPCIALRSRTPGSNAGTTQVISQVGIGDFVQDPQAPALAGNGGAAVFLGSPVTSLAGMPSGFTQVWAWTPAGGVRMVSIHLTGNLAADVCDWPAISGDGLWAFWSTAAANLVNSDPNGQRDIFTHGPLR